MKGKKIKILLIGGALSQNHGAEAMTLATVDILLKINSDIFIVIASARESDKNSTMNEKIKVIFERSGIFNCIIKIVEVLKTKIFKTNPKNEYLSIIYDSDLIIDISGDTISDMYSNYLRSVFWRYFAVILFRKPIIFYPQTIGPFNFFDTKIIARFILKRSNMIFTRENISYEYLKQFLNNPHNLRIALDSAFYLEKSQKFEYNYLIEENETIKIGFSISEYIARYSYIAKKLNDTNLYKNLITTMISFINFLIEILSCQVYLIPHVVDTIRNINDDRITQKKIFNSLKPENKTRCVNISENLDARVLKNIISSCDFFIGSRMHANIAAISSNVPTIAIAYSHKFKGIMSLFELDEFIINIQDLNFDILKSKFEKLLKNGDIIRKNLININLREKGTNLNQLIQYTKEIIQNINEE